MEVSLDRTTPDAFERFKQVMLAHDEVMECHMVAGGFDYLLKVRVTDMESYRRFLGDRIASVRGVQQTHTYFVMEEVKSTHRIVVPEGRLRLPSTLRGRARQYSRFSCAQAGDIDAAVVGHVDVVLARAARAPARC